MNKRLWMACWLLGSLSAWASDPYPSVQVRELPENLKKIWRETLPEMTTQSRCAAAFDSHDQVEKMTLQCSVHIRMAAEGARRSMQYCEEKRQTLKINAPCKIVQP